MKTLNKKLVRDIGGNKAQFVTIFLMIFIGMMAYSGIRAYMDGMAVTADKFYSENNLQDLDVFSEDISEADFEKIRQIPHVKNAERKLTLTGLMVTKKEQTIQLNFIESNAISKFYVADGIPFDKNAAGVWLDEYFAEKNNLIVGETIRLKYENGEVHEKIVGLINVPDHVYDIKDESAIFPDHLDYGFAYLSVGEFQHFVKANAMAEAGIPYEELFDKYVPDFDPQEYLVFTDVLVDVDDKSNVDFVKDAIEEQLSGLLAVTKIEDSMSYSSYQGEIEEGETYVGVFSGLFLFIAILSVITTMTRVVGKQRIQIGTLKALGFRKSRITAHYISYGFWISLLAAICGIFAGRYWIGSLFIGMEMSYFQVPNGAAVISSSSFVVAAAVVLAVSYVTYLTCRRVLKENAAETLRAEMPKGKTKSADWTMKFRHLNFATKWNLRDISRNKMRTLLGIAGITGCAMLLVCAFGMLDSMNHFIDMQFEQLYNFSYKLTLKPDMTAEQLQSLENAYGDNTSQTLGIEIKNGDVKEDNNLFVDDSKNYVRFLNHDGEFVSLADGGVFVTEKLAALKDYEIGDTICWHIYGKDQYYESKIVGFDRDPQNQNVKMTRRYLESLGLAYEPDTLYTNADLGSTKNLGGVELIQNISAIEEGMQNMIATMKSMVVLIIFIAAVLGSVIIYNLGVLSATEKQYQFATLKVLGFQDQQVQRIFIKQNNWITAVSIILGLPLGFYLTDFIFKMALADTYDFSASIHPQSYLYAVVGTFAVSWAVSKMLAKKIRMIDMVTSLKGNE